MKLCAAYVWILSAIQNMWWPLEKLAESHAFFFSFHATSVYDEYSVRFLRISSSNRTTIKDRLDHILVF